MVATSCYAILLDGPEEVTATGGVGDPNPTRLGCRPPSPPAPLPSNGRGESLLPRDYGRDIVSPPLIVPAAIQMAWSMVFETKLTEASAFST